METQSPTSASSPRRNLVVPIGLLALTIAVAWIPIHWFVGELLWWHVSRGGEVESKDEWPLELEYLVKEIGPGHFVDIHAYDLGGFIDDQSIWKFRTRKDIFPAIRDALMINSAVPQQNVPIKFWNMPPQWWRPIAKPSSTYHQSDGFDATQRGQDGSHYFVMYDHTSRTYHVWNKWNF